MDRDECFENPIVLDFLNVIRYLDERGLGDYHDEMFDMVQDGSDRGHVENNRYTRICRHWIGDDRNKLLFDLITEELKLEWEVPGWHKTLVEKGMRKPDDEPEWQQIVFWVSW